MSDTPDLGTVAPYMQPTAVPAVAAKSAATSATTPASSSAAPLPAGWFEAVDTTYNHPYFYNPGTGETRWVRPEADPEAAAAPDPKIDAKPVVDELPEGWVEAIDPGSGAVYYCNAERGVT